MSSSCWSKSRRKTAISRPTGSNPLKRGLRSRAGRITVNYSKTTKRCSKRFTEIKLKCRKLVDKCTFGSIFSKESSERYAKLKLLVGEIVENVNKMMPHPNTHLRFRNS
jgi:hypothetical protein